MAARGASGRKKLLPEPVSEGPRSSLSPVPSPRDHRSQLRGEPVYQPPPQRNEKSLPLRTTNPSPEPPAPSYYDENHLRRASTPRSLPPYPSAPQSLTGWAALSDTKSAIALAPPHYPESHRSTYYPSPYLPTPASSPPSSRVSISRSISTASSSLSSLPSIGDPGPFYRPSTRSVSESVPNERPPFYSPSSRLRLPIAPEPSSPPPIQHYQPRPAFGSPDGALLATPTPQVRSDDSIPSASWARVAPTIQSRPAIPSSSSEALPPRPKTPPAPFVYPSARTRARPSGTPSAGFKFRGRRKLKSPPDGVPLTTAARSSQDGSTKSRSSADAESINPPVPQPQPRGYSASVASGSSDGVSGSSLRPTPPESQPFYFPSARTRAHPKAPGLHFGGKGKKKEGSGGGTKLPTGFLRMGLGKKSTSSAASVGSGASSEPAMIPNQNGSRDNTPMPPLTHERGIVEEAEDISGLPAHQPQIESKVGMYPLDSYDPTLMETDRQTWELTRKLHGAHGGPSFHNYGGQPPRSALDLGCGAGHWMLDAAMAWRTAGTQVVGFDMMDTVRGMWATAQRQGVAQNLQFVRGNFVRDPLPFPDASFELVRMANLALCIPRSRWDFVLDQVRRVLVVGGRLEFIDDHVFFPYGKPAAPDASSNSGTARAPHLDTAIPSTGFSRMSLADVVNPRDGQTEVDDGDSAVYNLYGLEEEDEEASSDDRRDYETAPYPSYPSHRNGIPSPATFAPSVAGGSSISTSTSMGTVEAWHEQAQAARELEGLFEHMLAMKYGIHPRPAEFLFEILLRVFGGVREITAMHLTLAPPGHLGLRQHGSTESDVLAQSPGLILWPSTFIPLQPAELEASVSKHQRVLLSCKSALVDYAREVAEDGESDSQGEAAMEALWEYQNFIRERFNPPPETSPRTADDADSLRESVGSISSEALNEMQDYQSEFETRYASSSSTTRHPPKSNPPPFGESTGPTRVRKRGSRSSRRRDRGAGVAPAHVELIHARTCYVYEAVKASEVRGGFPLSFTLVR
ncbi:hypothetical protein C8F01DRAFT_1109166 [Mycena amicta]|nr:hypothetical protein C8F01DRAFT_1109166 [Mycena amicta]